MAYPRHFLNQTVPHYESLLRSLLPDFSLLGAIQSPENLKSDEAEILAALGRQDFYFFMVCVCGRTRIGPPGGFHWDWCRRLQTQSRPLLAMVSRKLFKSTLQTEGLPLWRATQDPVGSQSLTITEDLKLGKGFFRWVKGQIESNAVYHRLYPEIKPGRPWSDVEANLLNRSSAETGPTWALRTSRQAQAGAHVGDIHIDDWENDKNFESRTEQQRLCTSIDYMWPTINGPNLTISCTPYAEYGLTAHLLRTKCTGANPEMDLLAQPLRGRCEIDPLGLSVNVDDGVYPFPEEYDDESFIALEKLVADPQVFAWQYLLDMSFRGDEGFQSEWLRYFVLGEEPRMTVYMAGDPASGEGTSRPAIAAGGVDEKGNLYPLYSNSNYRNEEDYAEDYLRVHALYRPRACGVEVFGHGGHTSKQNLERYAREHGKELYLVEMKGAEGKIGRIRAELYMPYQRGKVLQHPALRGSEYERQLRALPTRMHPKVKGYIDEPDAMSRVLELCRTYGYREPVSPVAKKDRLLRSRWGRSARRVGLGPDVPKWAAPEPKGVTTDVIS